LLLAFLLLWYGGCFLVLAMREGRRWIATHSAQLVGLYGSITLGLALAEVSCRILVATEQPPSFGPRVVQYSPVLGWALIPGVEDIGAHGWRGPSMARTKEDGRFRIVCAGDSTTFGFHGSWEDAWPHQLETSLNRDADWTRAHGITEVLNLGVPGYGPDQSMLALEEIGLSYAPDVVIFHLCLNDFADASYDHHWLKLGGFTQYKPFYVLEDGRLAREKALVPLPRDPAGNEFYPTDSNHSAPSARPFRSALAQFLRNRARHFVAGVSRKPLLDFPQQHWPIHDGFRARYALARPLVWAMIKEMSRVASDAGAVFLVTLSPGSMNPVNGPEDAPPWRLATFLREYEDDAKAAGIPALNCIPEYFTAGGNGRFLLPHDPYHLNRQGNAFIAQTTARWLKNEYLAAKLRRIVSQQSGSN